MFYIYEKHQLILLASQTATEWLVQTTANSYKTMPAARAALTRICKAEDLMPTDPNYAQFRYAIAEAEYFHSKIEKQVKKKNMMNGEEFFETANTPYYCSPSSETYWSM